MKQRMSVEVKAMSLLKRVTHLMKLKEMKAKSYSLHLRRTESECLNSGRPYLYSWYSTGTDMQTVMVKYHYNQLHVFCF